RGRRPAPGSRSASRAGERRSSRSARADTGPESGCAERGPRSTRFAAATHTSFSPPRGAAAQVSPVDLREPLRADLGMAVEEAAQHRAPELAIEQRGAAPARALRRYPLQLADVQPAVQLAERLAQNRAAAATEAGDIDQARVHPVGRDR